MDPDAQLVADALLSSWFRTSLQRRQSSREARIQPGPFGHLAQHAGQHEDLDRRHLLGELAAAVVELVAVVVVGVSGDGGQQVDQVGDLRTRQADGDHGRSLQTSP
jgi:hypothetical protein